ncbi:GIY-YIG nuclease family protein [Candidatus Poribacteria bacterium]|nr:GIY-YIG nuclease family protein [Candidatus Poribacteria bacterium]
MRESKIKVISVKEFMEKPQPLEGSLGKSDPQEWHDLYFIHAWIDDNLIAVKIGISKDCTKRLANLQKHNLAYLDIFSYQTYPSRKLARKKEKEAHKYLKEHRIRGEWFRPVPAVIEYNPNLQPFTALSPRH